jgi:hypothetical protein
MKIFGIGLPKTGTTSIAAALRILQLKVYHNTKGNINTIIDSHDAIFDLFHIKTHLHKALAKYPDATLFWTIRPKEKWIISFTIHNIYARLTYAKHREINTQDYNNTWEQHKLFVESMLTQYNVIKIDTESLSENGWIKICNALQLEIPNVPFPVLNTASEKLLRISDLLQ